MASRFWVGGTGNTSDTAHWAATSGGAGGQTVPTSSDTATFDSSSGTGTVTVDVALQTAAMDWTTSSSLNLTQAVLLEVFGDLIFVSGMTYTPAGQTLGLRGGAANITTATKQPFNLTVNATGAKTLQDNLTLTNNLTLTLNALALNGKTVLVGNDCFQAGGVITGATSSVLTITRDFTITSGASSTLATVAVTVGRDCTMSGGTITFTGQTGFFKVNRSWLKTAGTLTLPSGTSIILNGNGIDGQFRNNASQGGTFQINSASGTGVWVLLATFAWAGTLRVTSGTFDSGGFNINTATITVTGTLTIDGGSFVASGSSFITRSTYTRTSGSATWGTSTTFTMNGTGTLPADAYNNLDVADTANAGTTVTFLGNTSCKNFITSNDNGFSAAANLSTFTLTSSGTFFRPVGGTFTAGSSTVVFTTSSTAAITFNSLTQTIGTIQCNVPGKTLQFDVAGTSIVSVANLILQGSFSNLLILKSSSGGVQFELDSSGISKVSGVDCTDWLNTGTQIIARMSKNTSNNTGIKFVRQDPRLGKFHSPVGDLATT